LLFPDNEQTNYQNIAENGDSQIEEVTSEKSEENPFCFFLRMNRQIIKILRLMESLNIEEVTAEKSEENRFGDSTVKEVALEKSS